jgi:hypothetical protein
MKIEKIEDQQLTAVTTKKNFLNSVVHTIFNICKYDKNFKDKSEGDEIDKKINSLSENIKFKKKLITKAEVGEKKLKELIKELDNGNNKMKYKIAEILEIEIDE